MRSYDPTRSAVQKQLKGMGCDSFEIGVLTERGMLLRTWNASEILKSLDWLKRENHSGANIYVRADREKPSRLVLIDDLTRDALAKLRASEHAPAVVVQTSPANWQAWIKLDEDEQDQIRREIARLLCREYGGDENSADAQHFGRLAGFTNRKPKHLDAMGQYPFVLLESYNGQPASGALELADAGRQELAKAKAVAVAVQRAAVRMPTAGAADELGDWYNSLCRYLSSEFGANFDASRADWIIAVRLFKRGHTYSDVARIISEYSPGIDDRKAGHVDDYVQRTAGKAEIWCELESTGASYNDVARKLPDLARQRATERADEMNTLPPPSHGAGEMRG